MKDWDKVRAYVLYQAGASDDEIGEEVGVHRQTVRRWRMEHDLPPNLPAPQIPPPNLPAPQMPPSAAPEPPTESEVAEVQDGSRQEGAEQDRSGPVELHLELAGGWARIRAPGWVQAAKLWRMMDVCISALRMEGGEPPERKEG